MNVAGITPVRNKQHCTQSQTFSLREECGRIPSQPHLGYLGSVSRQSERVR